MNNGYQNYNMAKDEKLDWFPLYVYEFITDIAGWYNSEVGVYFRLLCHQWIDGYLPGDLDRLARLANEPEDSFKKIWENIGSKFIISNNKHYNLKLEKIRKQQQKFIEKKSEAGEKGAEARWSAVSFTKFWDLYDKKVGDKEKLFKKWKKLSEEDQKLAMEYIPKYKLAQPDKKYRKNPETFLNNKSWNDELIDSKKVLNPILKAKPILSGSLNLSEHEKKAFAERYYKPSDKNERTGETGLGSELRKKMEQIAPKIK